MNTETKQRERERERNSIQEKERPAWHSDNALWISIEEDRGCNLGRDTDSLD
jgi:hypothetical protein